MRHLSSIATRHPPRQSAIIALAVTTLISAFFVLPNLGLSPRAGAGPATPATPCEPTLETDASAAVGTPVTILTLCVSGQPGTPVVVDSHGLMVTLTASSTKAGPVALTIELIAEDGEPINDATVSIKTRHLEMDHGESTDETVYLGDGRYFAERISMGMGGTWKTTVVIARPGLPPIELIFAVTLSGPDH